MKVLAAIVILAMFVDKGKNLLNIFGINPILVQYTVQPYISFDLYWYLYF